MKFDDITVLLNEKEFLEVKNDTHIEFAKNKNVSESTIDTMVVNIFTNNLKINNESVKQKATNIKHIDEHIPSKTPNGTGKGELDVSIIFNEELKVVIENKNPKEAIEEAIEEAIYYCNGLIRRGIDVRVAIGFNGIECVVRVYNKFLKKWKPFYIQGEELKYFPGEKILNLIYSNDNLTSIILSETDEGINIKPIINNLKEIYRKVKHIQNDNHMTVDFTVAFIGLKSILEKHHSILKKSWKNIGFDANDAPINNEDLKDNLINISDRIIKKMDQFKDIFLINDSEETESFNFKKTISEFKTKSELESLKYIYDEIDQLHNLHSSKIDLFGEVYEQLGNNETKKAFGQYFTRRHIISTLIKLFFASKVDEIIGETEEIAMDGQIILKPKNPKTICDPACGTGGFLTEAFKYINKEALSKDKYTNLDFSEISNKSFYGYDIFKSNAIRTKINMYLAGDGFSEIEQKDTLEEIESNNLFDYIITNPPYGGGNKIVDEDVTRNTAIHVNFLIKIVKMLKPGGEALVVIPDGILESIQLINLRKWFIENCELNKVIGLPMHSFAPYTHEKTYVLFFKKRAEPLKKVEDSFHEKVWMYIIDNDGYANSDKRFETNRRDDNGNWLHNELSEWRNLEGKLMPSKLEISWNEKEHDENQLFYNEWGIAIPGRKYGFVEMKDILEDEFTYYPTVTVDKIIRIIREEETKFIPTKITQLFDIKGSLIEKYEKILNMNSIFYIKGNNKFINKKLKPYRNKLKISELLRLFKENKAQVRKISEIYDENGKVLSEYIYILESNNIKVDYRAKSPIFFDREEYKESDDKAVLNVIEKDMKKDGLKKIINIFEINDDGDKSILEKYELILSENNIIYDEAEDSFMNVTKEMNKKILNLIPEKYLRNTEDTLVPLEAFKEQNTKLLSSVKEHIIKFFDLKVTNSTGDKNEKRI